MQTKIIVAAFAGIATVVSTSAFALGLGVQIGANLDSSIQAGARAVTSATAQLPVQIQLQAPVAHSRTSDINGVTAEARTAAQVNGTAAMASKASTTALQTGTSQRIDAYKGEQTAADKKRTGAQAKASIGSTVDGFPRVSPQSSVGIDASTKARVTGL